jgi:hypothetical protein
MMARALKERWPLDPQYRLVIIKRLMQVVANKNSTTREVVSATRALIAADALNLQEDLEPRGVGVDLSVNVNVASAQVVEKRIDMTTLTDQQLMQLVVNGGMLPDSGGTDVAGVEAGGPGSTGGESGEDPGVA